MRLNWGFKRDNNYFTEKYFRKHLSRKMIRFLKRRNPSIKIDRKYLGKIGMQIYKAFEAISIVFIEEGESSEGFNFYRATKDINRFDEMREFGRGEDIDYLKTLIDTSKRYRYYRSVESFRGDIKDEMNGHIARLYGFGY